MNRKGLLRVFEEKGIGAALVEVEELFNEVGGRFEALEKIGMVSQEQWGLLENRLSRLENHINAMEVSEIVKDPVYEECSFYWARRYLSEALEPWLHVGGSWFFPKHDFSYKTDEMVEIAEKVER